MTVIAQYIDPHSLWHDSSMNYKSVALMDISCEPFSKELLV